MEGMTGTYVIIILIYLLLTYFKVIYIYMILGTYNGTKKYGRVGGNQETKTAGGYSAANTVHEDFVIKVST